MKRPRPYIPLAVRVAVIRRQLKGYGRLPVGYLEMKGPAHRILSAYLGIFFLGEPFHLDHYPALVLRDFNPRTGKYSPDANDPEFLIYRTVADHRTKTFVHGERGQLSDTILRAKNKNIARNRNPKRRKAKIPQRKNPWPKGRKMWSRK